MKVLMMLVSFGLSAPGLSSELNAGVPHESPLFAPPTVGVTKEDLKKLLAARISDSIIIAYIKQHAPAPKLSIEDVADLKTAGASDGVLVAMLEASTPSKTPTASPPYSPPPSYESVAPYDSASSSYYYDYYPYGYSYPNFGFGFGAPFFANRFDRFHHSDHNFGRFGVRDSRGAFSSRGISHGGMSSGGGFHGGGGHR